MPVRPTDILREEHAVILDVLDNLETLANRARAGGEVTAEDTANLVHFFTRYVDAFHHEKEERLLFPALLEAGMQRDTGPIPVMLHEHDLGRRFVSTLARIASEDLMDRESFVAAATGFVELMRAHIRKENNALFVMAEQVLPPQRKQALIEAFAAHGRYDATPPAGSRSQHESA